MLKFVGDQFINFFFFLKIDKVNRTELTERKKQTNFCQDDRQAWNLFKVKDGKQMKGIYKFKRKKIAKSLFWVHF